MAGAEGSGKPPQEIIEIGKNTRFGSERGADPSAAATKKNKEQHTATIRGALRRLACSEFDITSPMSAREIAAKFGRKGTQINGAQLIAVKKFDLALRGDRALLQQVTDDIDGKQVQATVEAKTSLADLVNASVALERQREQEAAAAINEAGEDDAE